MSTQKGARLVWPDEDEQAHPRILILGEPGTGKTRLAGTFPSPLFIDTEPDGATTAREGGVPRFVVPVSPTMRADITKYIKQLRATDCKVGDYQVGTLVIDSIDQVQRAVQTFEILKGRTKMQIQDWGTLLELMYTLVMAWASLPIPVVVVGHVKRMGDDDESSKVKTANLAVRGALKNEMPGWFSYILHIVTGPDGKRTVIRDNMIYKGTRYLAKDRHNVLGGIAMGTSGAQSKIINITSTTGWPDSKIADTIMRCE